MNMRKALPLFVIASMMAALIPSALVGAAVTNTLSVGVGPVGTKTVVSGTITTWNGRYKIEIDANNDGDYLDAGEVLAGVATTLYADGYAYSKEIAIPNAYAGARRIHVTDLDAAGAPTADSFFTVQTQYLLKSTPTINYEAGAFTLNATIVGGDPLWPGLLDLQFRIKDATGTVIAGETTAYLNLVEAGGFGRFVQLNVLPVVATNYITWGVYTGLLDWDTAGVFPVANQGVASVLFTVRLTNKATYERTQIVNLKANVPAGKTLDKVGLVDPSGVETTPLGAGLGVVGGAAVFYGPAVVLVTGKNTALGTYTVKLYDLATGNVFKTQTFVLDKAGFVITIAAAADYSESSSYTAAVNIAAANQNVERMHTVKLIMTINYPDLATPVTSADLLGGFSVKAQYNTTDAATIVLDPLVAYAGPNKWTVSWKIPKDAVKGKNYHFVVVANAITDQYGNVGPTKDFDSKTAVGGNYWKVIGAQLYSGAAPGGALPILTYPGAANNLDRTLESRATADIRYPDGSRFAGSDLGQANGTVTTALGGKTYIANLAAADYNEAVGLWVMKWKIPYNAPIQADYTWSVQINNFKDQWGNKGPAAAVASANVFGVAIATIVVSDVAVDKTSVQTDEQITVTFKATYPSGDPVTTKAGVTWQKVDIVKPDGTILAAALPAGYDSVTKLWKVIYIIPTGSVSGVYNATVQANYVRDDTTTNQGPTVKKYVNFDVNRVSMIDVLAASNAAKAAADLASTKADAAKTAADTASTKADAAKAAADLATVAANAAKTAADGAKTAATSAQTTAQSAVTAATDAKTAATDAKTAATAAGTKADAATAAANAAKTSADAAKAATDSLTTMVYVAIAASVVAALAAIFAVMQITKKIA